MFYETVDSVEFLDAVVQETLRLCSLTPKLVKINRHEIILRQRLSVMGLLPPTQNNVQRLMCMKSVLPPRHLNFHHYLSILST